MAQVAPDVFSSLEIGLQMKWMASQLETYRSDRTTGSAVGQPANFPIQYPIKLRHDLILSCFTPFALSISKETVMLSVAYATCVSTITSKCCTVGITLRFIQAWNAHTIPSKGNVILT